jgi:hypothetical protein
VTIKDPTTVTITEDGSTTETKSTETNTETNALVP